MDRWRSVLCLLPWLPLLAVPARGAGTAAGDAETSRSDGATRTTAASRIVAVNGGEVTLSFNPDALAGLGLRVADVDGAVARVEGRPGLRFDVSTLRSQAVGGLQVVRSDQRVLGLGGGDLRVDGGIVFARTEGRIELRGLSLRRDRDQPFAIALVDARGIVWFTADHAHYAFEAGAPERYAMREMNLRLAAHFAQVLRQPAQAGTLVGSLEFVAQVMDDAVPAGSPSDGALRVCSAPWPQPGRRTDIALVNANLSGFWDSIYAPRCGLPPLPSGGACTEESRNGFLVIGGDASLRNVGDTGVAWYAHFSGRHPPYDNDQHPFLVWNLYRLDAAGGIRQIGVSAVKHAFYSVNRNCGCVGGNVVYPGCEDVYSFSSNDNGSSTDSSGARTEQNLAPRSEIIPHLGIWARCGSVWDADCDGVMDTGSGSKNLYDYRMLVEEAELLPPLADGARYLFESWYVVRDDVDPYNGMAYREIRPRKSGARWTVDLVGQAEADRDFHSGPVINLWVDPHSPGAHALNRELATPLGRARIAVRATPLGSGRWRYDYAVMNLDYAHVQIDPQHASEPNLKLLANHGFARFSVPLPSGTTPADLHFDDADTDPANDWTVSLAGDSVSWTAPSGNTLDWGTLAHFAFTCACAPAPGSVSIVGAATPAEAGIAYALDLLAPEPPGATVIVPR